MSIIRKKYDGDKWDIVAGFMPHDFEKYIENMNPGLLQYLVLMEKELF